MPTFRGTLGRGGEEGVGNMSLCFEAFVLSS